MKKLTFNEGLKVLLNTKPINKRKPRKKDKKTFGEWLKKLNKENN